MNVPAVGSHIALYPYEGGKINVFNKNTGKTFLMGEKEAAVIALLNGVNTLEDIHRRCPFFSANEIGMLITEFDKIGLFTVRKKKFNILKIKISLFNPNSLFSSKSLVTRFLYYLIMLLSPVMLIFGIACNFLLAAENPASAANVSTVVSEFLRFGIVDYIGIFVFAAIFLSLHEFGHMISARYYDVNVPEIGVMLYFFMPCAYTNISGINLLKNNNQKIAVLVSGTMVNVGIIGLLYILMNLIADIHFKAFLLGLIAANLLTIMMNCMIFLKFDGYYIAEVLFGEGNLRENATNHMKQVLMLLFSKDKRPLRQFRAKMRLGGSEQLSHIAYLTFSIVSSMFIPLIVLNTVLSVIQSF